MVREEEKPESSKWNGSRLGKSKIDKYIQWVTAWNRCEDNKDKNFRGKILQKM